MAKKQDKNFLFKICELLATIGILGNTLILIIFQNTDLWFLPRFSWRQFQ